MNMLIKSNIEIASRTNFPVRKPYKLLPIITIHS